MITGVKIDGVGIRRERTGREATKMIIEADNS